MIEKIEGIVTDIVKHNDSHNVVTLYTRGRGRMAFLIPVGKSKSGRMRNSLIQPLAVLSADVNIRAGKELYSLRQVNPVRLWRDIYSNPVKSSILFFVTEFCSRLLRQYPADVRMWDFITYSLEILDRASPRHISNFHIALLMRMTAIAGIEPAATRWESGDRFDMLSGEMVASGNPDFLRRRLLISEEESSRLPLLLRINYRNMNRFRFTRAERNQLLQRLIEYYSIHFSISREFKSLDVLRELFD